jgi:hypothetical protein
MINKKKRRYYYFVRGDQKECHDIINHKYMIKLFTDTVSLNELSINILSADTGLDTP